ncbi:M23 family metallopeptidase [Plebeiibacterium sediminum]|uniref:M23 family metallopeptidase n=1 Tax=Plebeiibacterium sediminum TaxID=2992112 RepID=A0AAE3M4X7_9BACT|nr:M23 family metallopeptidase [Plebeiobacterium sediminum]MCW3787204.1 M23 family metallopeptidase [Plebeiobacterium sediminum]
MDNSKEKKNFIQKIRNKYRLAIFNEQTYEELWAMRLSRLNVFTVLGTAVVILIVLVSLLIAYTGLKEYIPGFPDGNERILMVRNVNRVDSLIQEIEKRDEFFKSIKAVVQGEVLPYDEIESDTNKSGNIAPVSFNKSEADEEFREKVEKEEKYNLSVLPVNDKIPELSQVYFYTPLKGFVVKKFIEGENHFGVDIVSKPGETVLSIMSGTVVFSGWTVETGYVLMIQHGNDIISAYKHNSKLLKKAGDKIEAGEAIANVGNSGELTTGPHLHFELWYQGKAVDPEQYILFE